MAPVTSFYVALVGALLTVLAINTTRQRIRAGREPDARAKEAIQRASRAHGNTLEHAMPLLLVMLCAELNGASPVWLERIGAGFLVARVLYVYGMLKRPVSPPMRLGAGLTYVLDAAAVYLLLVTIR